MDNKLNVSRNISNLNLAILKPQNWNICRLLLVLIANRLSINIKTGGTYGDTKIVGKWVNKSGRPPNGIDIIRVNLLLSIATFMLLVLILLIQNNCKPLKNDSIINIKKY